MPENWGISGTTRFVKGQSGNPGGRPKSNLGPLIREQTADGVELVEFMLSVFRGKRWSLKLRMEAATWLADRGFGRPVQATQISGPDSGPVVVAKGPDMSRFSDEDLLTLERIYSRASAN
jgi:Family of unknown function (DUF5681)